VSRVQLHLKTHPCVSHSVRDVALYRTKQDEMMMCGSTSSQPSTMRQASLRPVRWKSDVRCVDLYSCGGKQMIDRCGCGVVWHRFHQAHKLNQPGTVTTLVTVLLPKSFKHFFILNFKKSK